MSTNFLFSNNHPAMFCLYTSSKLSLPYFEFLMKVNVMGLIPGYLSKSFLLYQVMASQRQGGPWHSPGAPRQIWARQGPLFYPNFLTSCFLLECIEIQNLVKAQALGALPALAPLHSSESTRKDFTWHLKNKPDTPHILDVWLLFPESLEVISWIHALKTSPTLAP